MDNWLKRYRIFSISCAIFISCMFYEMVAWITSFDVEELNALGAGAGVAISGIFGSMVAALKFTYTFAKNKIGKDVDNNK